MKSDANPKLSILLQGEFACTNFMKLYQETKSAHASISIKTHLKDGLKIETFQNLLKHQAELPSSQLKKSMNGFNIWRRAMTNPQYFHEYAERLLDNGFYPIPIFEKQKSDNV